ncbi:MAG: leucyl aminopeptidase family protein, partial [Phycisphaerales bacterium]|nr:leucyl aminopeptidase family protein [Phycisphaerales bacterium]
MFKSIDIASGTIKAAPLVTGVFSDESKTADGAEGRSKSKRNAQSTSQPPGFKGETGETFVLPNGDVMLGLGKRAEMKPDTLRIVGARLIKRLDRLALKKANLALPKTTFDDSITPQIAGRCVGEGFGLANWRVDMFAGSASNAKPVNPAITIGAGERELVDGLKHGLALADSTNYARRIAATPPNICNPGWIAEQARKLARDEGLKFKLIDFAQAQKLGMGGIVNVGMGSAAKPCLIVLEHRPARIAPAAKNVRLALIGKTITYDTGGYSLKINNTMKGMKYDKCGGTAVLGAMHAIARMKLPIHVVGLLPAAENMVSEDSYRPDDIITMYNGVSVEVTNTDAEGRLVLGDALAYACKDFKATAIVDLATLTGGMVTALGHFCAGLFCNDEPLLKRVNAAAESSGDKVWRMPLWKDHKEFMRAQHADILNSNPSRNAHPVQGAAFLAYFVDEKIPWAHIDIAGVSNVDSDKDLFVQGPTGYGVRLLVD